MKPFPAPIYFGSCAALVSLISGNGVTMAAIVGVAFAVLAKVFRRRDHDLF